jgi:ribosomal RNA assembly protein
MPEEYSYELRIPRERIAVLIGKSGEVKNNLEQSTKTKIQIDSKEGDIVVTGKDALNLFTVREVIRAIGRGFNPEFAQTLLKQDNILEVINLGEYTKSSNSVTRLKGRVIGAEGRSRKTIEDLTETNIVVYGKTISIIGESENVTLARRAIESLLAGSPHANVYRWLEKKRREAKRFSILGKEPQDF